MAKTRYMVYAKNRLNGDEEIQTIVDTLDDAVWYAKDNAKYQTQYIAKIVTLKIIKKR